MAVSAKNAESVARREREDEERLVRHDVEDDEELDEDEVTTDVFEVDISGGSSPWATTFLECASEGDLATVTKLLDEGKVDLNDVDVDGFTALMIAAAEAQTDVAMYLIERGADVSIRTHEMRSTALHFAAKSGEARVVEAICQQDPQRVDAQNLDGDTPLVWACTEGRANAVRALLAHNANVNVVSHRAMSVLICAVMLRGRDASEHEDDDSDAEIDEQGIASDADRAEIVRLLLSKNSKLVNYQDRDGSTAMHLAASHGYIKCVKALLEFGADITLRNAIGQTALEEAEETGVGPKSDLCVQYLRIIWKKLEEEAAARMMAMLEMEETAPSSSTKTSKKSGKKKSKKTKRRGSKTTGSASTGGTTTDKTGDDEEDGSSDEEDEQPKSSGPSAPAAEPSPAPSAVVPEATADAAVQESSLQDGGVWTTVGRKHQQYLAQRAAETLATSQEMETIVREAPTQKERKNNNETAPKKSRPATPPRPPVTPSRPPAASSSTSAASKVTPRSQPETVPGPAPKIVPASSRSPPKPPAQEQVISNTAKRLQQPLTVLGPTSPPPVGSPFSTFQSLHQSNRLYERYEAPDRTKATSSLATSVWRSSSSTSRSPAAEAPTFSLAPSSSATPSPSSTIWRYTSPSTQASQFTTRRWIGSAPVPHRSPEDELRRFLECGICRELVHDNRQCTATPCLQLYCIGCLVRATASTASFHCVKCRQAVDPRAMDRNELAQAQAAALALAAQRPHTHQHASTALEEMNRLLHRTGDKIASLEIDPVVLVPGANLSALSVGQLDALEELHLQALQQLTHARIENARATERLRIEEYLKTQRDLFQFTPQR